MTVTDESNDGTPWWVVQTKPQAELIAMQNLKNQGLTSYCPLFKKESVRSRQLRINALPLFQCYVFVKADKAAQQNIHVIRSTFGVNKLLKIGEVPTRISCQLINELRQMEAKKFDKTQPYFKKGDHVKINVGLYKHLEAVYQIDDGIERAVVLLSIINKETPLLIDKHSLIKV